MNLEGRLHQSHEESYREVLDHLKSKQIRMTESRKAIVRYMIEADHHPSAEKIYRDLLPEFPSMSLATVYNNLRVLIDEGFVSELKVQNDNTTYFDFMGHDHLNVVCEKCGKIADFMEVDLSIFKKEAEEKTGYKVTREHFLLYGICPDCQVEA